MTVEAFVMILSILSVVSSLLTEAIKKAVPNEKIGANIIVLCISVIVGLFGMVSYYIWFNIPFNAANIICIPIMMVANWLVAMLGYDKVVQTITQVKTKEV